MFLYPLYTAIKEHLKTNLSGATVPVFFYIGQYQKGKENTSYTIPAIYIELPKNMPLNFYPKKVMSAKGIEIKIHYISYAPFTNADNSQQEAAIAQHEARLKEIDKLTNGWVMKDIAGLNLTEQLISNNGSFLNFADKAVYSVMTYKTEVYSRHLV